MWLYVPESNLCQSSVSVRAMEGLSSGCEPFSTLAQSCTWKSNFLSQASWFRLWKKDSLIPRQFGQISNQSLMRSQAERWISSRGASLAPPSALPGEESRSQMTGTSGPMSVDLLNGLGFQSSFILKTYQGSSRLEMASPDITGRQSVENFERWATQLRKESSRRKKLALRTAAIGSISSAAWPTSRARDEFGPQREMVDGQCISPDGTRWGLDLPMAAVNWPTASAQNAYADNLRNDTNFDEETGQGRHAVSLVQVASRWKVDEFNSSIWPTATAAEAGKIGNRPNYGQVGLSNHPAIVGLPEREKMGKSRKGKAETTNPDSWPTANTRDNRRGCNQKQLATEVDKFNSSFGLYKKDALSSRWPTARAGNPGSRKPGTGGEVLQEKAKNWPTATSNSATYANGERGPNLIETARRWPTARANWHVPSKAELDGGNPKMRLEVEAALWPTAVSSDHRAEGVDSWEKRRIRKALAGINLHKPLRIKVATWTTPAARDWRGFDPPGKRIPRMQFQQYIGVTQRVSGMKTVWPTAAASDAYTTRRVTGNWRGDDLVSFTREQWPTITSSEHKHRMRGNSQQSHGLTTTARKSPIHSSPQGQMKQISGGSSSDIFRGLNQPIARNPSHQCSPKCRRLNPNFVEQLQGLLPGWTDPTLDYGSWEMELFRVHARLLFESSQLN